MKKNITLLLVSIVLVVISSHTSIAQKYVDESSGLMDRLYFGGNFGLQFGSYTHIEASPIAGYMINEKLSAGVGVIYQYFRIRGNSQTGDYETNIYGGKLFARYNLSQQVFGYTEYENINRDFRASFSADLARIWVPAFFVGGGYFQPIGNKAGFTIMALYNLLHNPARSPYNSPFVLRVGFTI